MAACWSYVVGHRRQTVVVDPVGYVDSLGVDAAGGGLPASASSGQSAMDSRDRPTLPSTCPRMDGAALGVISGAGRMEV